MAYTKLTNLRVSLTKKTLVIPFIHSRILTESEQGAFNNFILQAIRNDVKMLLVFKLLYNKSLYLRMQWLSYIRLSITVLTTNQYIENI